MSSSSSGPSSDPLFSASAADAAARPSGGPRWLGKRIGKFRLAALLGKGSWGKVFEAEDETLRRRVALKLLPGTNEKGDAAERMTAEARAAAAIEHPSVIQVYEAGAFKQFFYIATELAEGGSIADALASTGPFPPDRAATLCAEAAEGLAAAHAIGIVHRDVKPANLLLARSGRCKVADFGLAAGGEASDPLHASRAAGTPYYIAPEVVRGATADARSDVYSLGATLYHMLSGHKPFEKVGDDVSASRSQRTLVLRAHVERDVPNVRRLVPGLDAGLAAVVARAMAKNPAERFADAREMARALRQHARPGAPGAPGDSAGASQVLPVMPAPAAASPAAPRPRWLIPAVAAGLTLVVGAAVLAAVLMADGGGVAPLPATAANPPAATTPVTTAPPAPAAPRRDSMAVHTFRLDATDWADKPESVHVAGDFNNWSADATPLSDGDGDHVWLNRLRLTEGLHTYKFVIDGERWINDPAADRTLDANDNMGGVNSGVIVGR